MNWKALAFVGIGIVVLGVLFVVMRPAPDSSAPANPARVTEVPITETPLVARPNALDVSLAIKGGRRAGGPELISAQQGQRLHLTVVSDKADELHLHGYDIATPLKAGEPVELALVLDVAGRFEIELHEAHGVIAVLEVQPKP